MATGLAQILTRAIGQCSDHILNVWGDQFVWMAFKLLNNLRTHICTQVFTKEILFFQLLERHPPKPICHHRLPLSKRIDQIAQFSSLTGLFLVECSLSAADVAKFEAAELRHTLKWLVADLSRIMSTQTTCPDPRRQ